MKKGRAMGSRETAPEINIENTSGLRFKLGSDICLFSSFVAQVSVRWR